MATIRKRGDHRFQVRWWDGDLQRSKTFTTSREAQAFRATLEVEQARGDWLDPRQSRQPLAPLALKWLEGQRRLAPRTFVNIEGRLRNHLLPHLGDQPLSRLRPSDVEAWVGQLTAKGLGPTTVTKCYQDLDQILRMAVRDNLLRQSPCIGIRLPCGVFNKEMAYLNHDEVAALAAAVAPRYRALIVTAAYAGLRAGELGALRRSRLDLLHRRIEVVESVGEVGGHLVSGPTKTKERRTVNLPGFLAEALSDHLVEFPSQGGFVFSSPIGAQLRHRNFYDRQFKPAVARAGLPDRLRFHDLRHTCAALLIAEGWTLEQLKRHLGHSSIRVTSDRYAHLYEGHDRELLDRLDAKVRAVPAPPPVPAVADLVARRLAQ